MYGGKPALQTGAMELDTEKDVGVAGKVGCVMGNVGSNFIFGATD